MPQYTTQDDVYTTHASHFLSPSPRKSPLRQNISNRRSTNSLRPPSSLGNVIDESTANGLHSLAHELAVALMPEPSVGSKLLAEEFGIEFDEGAEGIDEPVDQHHKTDVQIVVENADVSSFADELGPETLGSSSFAPPQFAEAAEDDENAEHDPVFGSSSFKRAQRRERPPEQDAMAVLAENLEYTDKFLGHLRILDNDSAGSPTLPHQPHQPALERIASEVISRINNTVRDREGQVRELLEYEREFRKIAGEIGGSDVLAQLDELESVDDLSEAPMSVEAPPADHHRQLETLEEEPQSPTTPYHQRSSTNDWELDPDRHLLGDEAEEEVVASPVKDSFQAPPPLIGPPTPAKAIPQMAHLRSFTASLVTSLATISEQAQVNGAATTEAGRKIRALKNKMGGWRTDWDSAERSRMKIDKWEAGILDGDGIDNIPSNLPLQSGGTRRVDGRKIVEEHLRAFELALADAAVKTQAIMAR